MIMDGMNLCLMVISISFLIFSSTWNVLATLYTRCDSPNSKGFIHEPIMTDTCPSLLEATAAQCLKTPLCDLFLKNGTQCSYYTAIDRDRTCNSGGQSGDISYATFRTCNCTLIEDQWFADGLFYQGPGPFYLFVTPEAYTCDQGQDVCMSLGGIMAEFHNIDELHYALMLITGSVFIGGKLQGGKYVWATTGQEIDGSLFAPGEPSHMAPCVQIWRNALDDTYLNFLNPILCQKRLQ